MNNINLIGWFGVTVAGLMMYKSVWDHSPLMTINFGLIGLSFSILAFTDGGIKKC